MKNTGTSLGIVLVVVLVLLLFGGAGMMMGFGGYGMMGGYGGMGGMMRGFAAQGYGINPLGALISLVVWALIIAGVVLLVIWLARTAGRAAVATSASQAPFDTLKTRYARGEITKEQFDAIRKDLE